VKFEHAPTGIQVDVSNVQKKDDLHALLCAAIERSGRNNCTACNIPQSVQHAAYNIPQTTLPHNHTACNPAKQTEYSSGHGVCTGTRAFAKLCCSSNSFCITTRLIKYAHCTVQCARRSALRGIVDSGLSSY